MITRKRVCCLLFGFGAIFVLVNFIIDAEDLDDGEFYSNTHHDDVENVPEIVNETQLEDRYKKVYLPAEEENKYPIIVWWTPFTGYQRVVWECSRGSCLFTHSRTEFDNPLTEAFMFYGTDIPWTDLPVPRNPRHYWGVIHEESPKNNWVLAQPDGIRLFNITSTFSRYSHYSVVLQFLEKLEDLTRAPVFSIAEKNSKRSSLAPVMYLHSDCDPPSDRDSYMRELMKYIAVDSYGKCIHNKDLPEHLINPLTFNTDDLHNIQAQYKFTISFENAICHDYITEKFWRPLTIGSVPVVRGSPTIKDWAPQNSIIVAEEFSSPQQLAEYLLFLDRNDTEYEKFLKFKSEGIKNKRLLHAVESRPYSVNELDGKKKNAIEGFECHVCDVIWDRKQRIEKGEEPVAMVANISHLNCLAPAAAISDSSVETSELRFWRWHEMCSRKQATVIREFVENQQPYPADFESELRDSCLTVSAG